MQSYDFGVLPYQLFNQKFPKIIKFCENIEEEIYEFNKKQFKEDHVECLKSGKESFICKGEKGINEEYLKIIMKKQFNSILKKFFNRKRPQNLCYLFIGDVLEIYLFIIKRKIKHLG